MRIGVFAFLLSFGFPSILSSLSCRPFSLIWFNAFEPKITVTTHLPRGHVRFPQVHRITVTSVSSYTETRTVNSTFTSTSVVSSMSKLTSWLTTTTVTIHSENIVVVRTSETDSSTYTTTTRSKPCVPLSFTVTKTKHIKSTVSVFSLLFFCS